MLQRGELLLIRKEHVGTMYQCRYQILHCAHYHYDPMGRLASHQVSHQQNKQTTIQRGYAYDHAYPVGTRSYFMHILLR